MSKLVKLTDKISDKISEIQSILRNIELISQRSPLGVLITNLWLPNKEEYGELKYILRQPMTTIPEDKYHIICLKYCQTDNTAFHTSWCIQIPQESDNESDSDSNSDSNSESDIINGLDNDLVDHTNDKNDTDGEEMEI